ncbi:MAG: hypothetical protein ABIJ94_01200 [candidate division WOR-3 bacterium]
MKKVIHKTKKYVEDLRAKPHSTRKRLMWFYSIITIIIILFFWANYFKGQLTFNINKAKEQLGQNQRRAINVPSLIENLKSSFKEFIEFLKPKPNFENEDKDN